MDATADRQDGPLRPCPNYGPGPALVARFKTSDGEEFFALYGHLDTPHKPGHIVTGEILGTVNASPTQHLHFGIYPASSVPSTDPKHFRGRTTDPNNQYGWTDPLRFLDERQA